MACAIMWGRRITSTTYTPSPSMTVTVTNMHHPGVYMTRRPANRQAWRRGVLVVLGGALVAFVLYWAAAGVLGDNTQE